jgi:hypothetical protein
VFFLTNLLMIYVFFFKRAFWSEIQLKLILNHQESRPLENHNMFKFHALLGITCLHKKGKQQTYFKHLKSHNNCSKCDKEFSGENASGNLKQHEKVCQGPKKLHFCQYCTKQFKLNWLIIRHEKGYRDRPGWINVIVWIDSFFELRCYGAVRCCGFQGDEILGGLR